MTRARCLILAAMIGGHLLFNFLWLTIANELRGLSEEIGIPLLLGACIGQANLIASWAALGPGSLWVRFPWSAFCALLAWYALVLGGRFGRADMTLDLALWIGELVAISVLVTQAPLWILGRLLRTRLTLTEAYGQDGSGGEAEVREQQFSLRQMLMGIALTAVALALGRVVLPGDDFGGLDFEPDLFLVIVPVFAVVNLLVAAPCVWGAFAPVRLLPLWIPIWLLFIGLVSCLEVGVLFTADGSGPDLWAAFRFCLLCNVAQCGVVFGTLALLRPWGFRMIRTRAPVAER